MVKSDNVSDGGRAGGVFWDGVDWGGWDDEKRVTEVPRPVGAGAVAGFPLGGGMGSGAVDPESS